MQVHRDINQLPSLDNPVLTIGTFDGVHIGHQKILKQLNKVATEIKGETMIITFHPHPRTITASQEPLYLINTIEERIELLSPHIDHLVIVSFTDVFSRMSAEEYLNDFLVAKFHPHTVIIGYDHRFGMNRAGDYLLLEKFYEKGKFDLKEIPAEILRNNAVSSTRIRNALLEGDMESANALLGYDFFFQGLVVEGNRLGNTIGYPTANLHIENDEKLIPGNGVYAVNGIISNVDNQPLLSGMMNIGFRPTVGGTKKMVEVHLFDFSQDIYGQTIRVYVKKKLRDEKKFEGLNELRLQLGKDREAAVQVLK